MSTSPLGDALKDVAAAAVATFVAAMLAVALIAFGSNGAQAADAQCVRQFQSARTRADTLQVALDNTDCAKLLRLVERKDGAK